MIWSLALVVVVPAILIDYEEVRDEYCSPENVSEHVMEEVEDCFAIGLLDFGVRRRTRNKLTGVCLGAGIERVFRV